MTGITALLYFTILTLVVMFIYVGYRVVLVLSFKKKANEWTRGQPTGDPAFITRAHHAHLNCVENLPVFAVIVLASVALHKEAVVDVVACYFIALRLAQTTVHLISTAPLVVFVRANLFILQIALCFWMIWGLLH
jgi:uncharacterized MAPEG superfamily protein